MLSSASLKLLSPVISPEKRAKKRLTINIAKPAAAKLIANTANISIFKPFPHLFAVITNAQITQE